MPPPSQARNPRPPTEDKRSAAVPSRPGTTHTQSQESMNSQAMSKASVTSSKLSEKEHAARERKVMARVNQDEQYLTDKTLEYGSRHKLHRVWLKDAPRMHPDRMAVVFGAAAADFIPDLSEEERKLRNDFVQMRTDFAQVTSADVAYVDATNANKICRGVAIEVRRQSPVVKRAAIRAASQSLAATGADGVSVAYPAGGERLLCTMADLEKATFEVVAQSSFARPGTYVGQLFLFLYDHIDKLLDSLRQAYYPVHHKDLVWLFQQRTR